jgi:hypothetical protein
MVERYFAQRRDGIVAVPSSAVLVSNINTSWVDDSLDHAPAMT